jgi:hypothetical protein
MPNDLKDEGFRVAVIVHMHATENGCGSNECPSIRFGGCLMRLSLDQIIATCIGSTTLRANRAISLLTSYQKLQYTFPKMVALNNRNSFIATPLR